MKNDPGVSRGRADESVKWVLSATKLPHGIPEMFGGDSLVLVAIAVGSLPGALGVQCGGAAMTSVTTTHERIGPDGTSAENG